MYKKTTTFLLFFSALFIIGCSGPAVYTAPNAPVSRIGNAPTLAQVDKAVKDSLIGRGWIPQKVSSNSYLATYRRRGLKAKIEVIFDTKRFNINHLSSQNLDYDSSDETIHPTYNKWIERLELDIQKRVDRNVKVDRKKASQLQIAY